MTEYKLRTPIFKDEIKKLKAGDTVYISGIVFTARDAAHARMLEFYNMEKKLPLNVKGQVLFHCGPIVREVDGKYEVIAAGPTTSTRMEPFEDVLIEKLDVHVIIGKGGMGSKTIKAMKKHGAIYCAFTGGASALATEAIKEVKSVKWLDLGMPEAIWVLGVEDFGPLIVAIDSYGNNLYLKVMNQVDKNRKKIYQRIKAETQAIGE